MPAGTMPHIAIALGTAKILYHFKDRISGNVKFIFQPAEEGLGGASFMIEEGALDNPATDAIIALHVSPLLKSGQISVGAGTGNGFARRVRHSHKRQGWSCGPAQQMR